jgi:alkylated DNA repair dioxygenase AlkB
MKFTYNGEHKEIYVKPNSLYIMSGDSRYVWSHSMPVKKSDVVNGIKIKRDRRISITFRNVFIPI